MHDLFDAAYLEGVTEEIAPPQESGHELMPRAALAEAFALEGCVLTPERAIEKGYVVVGADRTIASVSEAKPQGVPVHRTDGVICPGLIDLHGHPEFNIFAAWEPPREFVNRYAWRGSDLYKELVREPQNKLLGALPPKTQLRYAEIRALVGGVTAIQGTGGQATSYQDEALVRNVDKWIFGEQRARSMIDLPSGSRGRPELESILAGIESGKVRAFYIHLAEGRSDNERSREELDTLVELGGLTERTVIIHGTALSEAQLGDVKDAGASLVWSPQSNLRLYGETTKAAEALRLGLPVGLGADWLPSGSTSLLAELKVARRSLQEQGSDPSAKRLVEMVTSDAASIAGLEDKLGSLRGGAARGPGGVRAPRGRSVGERRPRRSRVGRAGDGRRRSGLRQRAAHARAGRPPGPRGSRPRDRLGQADAARHELPRLRGRPRRAAAEPGRPARGAHRGISAGGPDLFLRGPQPTRRRRR